MKQYISLFLLTIFSSTFIISMPCKSLKEKRFLYELNGIVEIVSEGKYHYYIINATIDLRSTMINSTHAKVYVNITGLVHQAGRLMRNQTILVFVVDIRNNYAWFNNVPIGFFPLYIFPVIGYTNASVTFTFLGRPLSLITY